MKTNQCVYLQYTHNEGVEVELLFRALAYIG